MAMMKATMSTYRITVSDLFRKLEMAEVERDVTLVQSIRRALGRIVSELETDRYSFQMAGDIRRRLS